MRLALVVGLIVTWLACGCGSTESARRDDSPAPSDLTGLAGRRFVLESEHGFEPVGDTRIGLSFGADSVSFDAECVKRGTGRATLRDGRLIVGAEVGRFGVTDGCNASLSAQDDWFSRFLRSKPSVVLDGDRVTLTGYGATLVFVSYKVVYPDQPLVGTTWSVMGVTRDGAMELGADSDATLVFRENRSVHIDTTCNTGTGRYSLHRDRLTLTDVSYTQSVCGGQSVRLDENIREVITNGTFRFTIDSSSLRLRQNTVTFFAHKR